MVELSNVTFSCQNSRDVSSGDSKLGTVSSSSSSQERQERPQRTASANRAQLEFQLRKTVPTAKVLSAPRQARGDRNGG